MTRTIPPTLAGILEVLELEQPTLVTSEHLTRLVEQHGLRTPVNVIAVRPHVPGGRLGAQSGRSRSRTPRKSP